MSKRDHHRPKKTGPKRPWRRGDQFLVHHKDDSIIVVDKKAGLLSVRTPSGKGDDLIGLLRQMVGTKGRGNPVLPVHRLDRVVSGLIVSAQTRAAQNHLIHQFKAHTVQRKYIACVEGIIPDDEGTFESYLRSFGRILRMASDPNDEGQHAVTHWKVLERFEKAEATLVEVRLETGVRNQIRVHFAEAGFPLLGERKYLSEDDERYDSNQGIRRIFLHAAELGFVHPDTEKEMFWEADLPPELTRWLAKLQDGKKLYSLPRRHRGNKRSGKRRS